MASGVSVSSECMEAFRSLKLSRKHKYIIFSLSADLKTIVPVKTSAEQDYDKFVGDLPEDECRWAVYDFEFEKDSAKRNKICFISWSPDSAKIKQKMLFASSRDALRRSFDGIAVEIQGTDYSEIAHEAVLFKANSSSR
ncbi:hypothetical protein PISMIDRAFT_676621 [Pisolithus microcarpus 441]|uniref:Cofilin n=1 Tax=Pisolithus microcarpus 441 TaxID=765257 RepID=A0A0C9YM61_9AGAM|nr:actin depolymerizing factor [Pisolithus microcarpus]KIK26065.1 hypothetical protein PISMIDRAFT_676621 [Pisolithus microcarpus 441]